MNINDLEKVEPMKQIIWASVIQFVVICFMLGSMVIINGVVN